MENFIMRRKSKVVRIGGVLVGGDNPISIQSMTNTDTRDVKSTVYQIKELEEAGCEIIRVAVLDQAAAEVLSEIKKNINIPLIADVHFDYKLALKAIESGIDKLRINPGNIGDSDKVSLVVKAAKERNIPIRIGVNSGSLEKNIIAKYGRVTVQGLVESVLGHVKILEDLDFTDIIVAVKGSDVPMTIEAYKKVAEKIDYPLHIGITETGTLYRGSVKSAVGIGSILSLGLGDTMRVSLSDNPVHEIECAKMILSSLHLRAFGPEFIICPTCGRTEIGLIELAKAVEERCKNLDKNIKIAIMGCVVNGPGEAREADIGVAGGRDCGIIFKKGEILRKVPEKDLLSEFMKEIELL